jgi:hypothetical protein
MNEHLKSGKWSIQYYDLFKLIGKHKLNGKDSVIIGYADICLLNIIIQLGNIKKNTNCTMKNSNFAEILNAKERQIQVYLKHLKDLGIITTFEDRLKGTKHITTKRTIYVKYDRIKELTTCDITRVLNAESLKEDISTCANTRDIAQPHVDLGCNNTCNHVSTTCEITHPYNDSNNDKYNDNIGVCKKVSKSNKDIIFSRKEDIIILSRDTKLSESELKQIIISSNISDADDFIYFWKKINEEGSDPFGGYKDTKSKSFVLEKYNYYISKDKEYNIGDRLEDADFIIDNDSGHLRDIFFTKNFYMCNLSDEQISELKKLKVATYFFRRNDKNK